MLVSFDTAVTARMWRLRGWNKFRQPFNQWLKWSCEAGGHLTKPQQRLERDTGGVDRGKAIGWSKPHTHSPTQLIWRYLDIK